MSRTSAFFLAASLVCSGGLGRAEFRTLVETDFPGPGLPTGWVQEGAPWTIAQGALSPEPGSDGTILSYRPGGAGQSTLDQKQLEARVTVMTPASRFALCTQGTYGSLAEVDGAAQVLRLYQNWSGGALPPVLTTVPLPFALKSGGNYTLSLIRTLGASGARVEHVVRCTLTDEASGRSVSREGFFVGGVKPWPGHMWGAPGVMVRSGRIKVRAFSYRAPYPATPRLWIGGDSFVEGDSIFAAKDRRFAQLTSAALAGDVVISGGGGATSGDLLSRLPVDLAPFSPRYCLILIGTNDRDYAVWLGHVRQILAYVRARGATPVLGTLAPLAGRQAFLNQANAWIRASG